VHGARVVLAAGALVAGRFATHTNAPAVVVDASSVPADAIPPLPPAVVHAHVPHVVEDAVAVNVPVRTRRLDQKINDDKKTTHVLARATGKARKHC
jgi:hypothetical protein